MANVLIMNSRGFSKAATNTYYDVLADMSIIAAAAEANAEITYRTPGAFSNLYSVVSANGVTSSSTIRLRINRANVNAVLSIGATTSGEFWDQTSKDRIYAGDEVDVQSVIGSGGSSLTHSLTAIVFSADAGTMKKYGTEPVVNVSAASTTTYQPISGGFYVPMATEANAQFKFKTAGTFKNACLYVVTNGRGTASTYSTRKNAASNGNVTISIGSAVTGLLEDTTNSDTVAVDDLWNHRITTGTGAGNLYVQIYIEFVTTNNKHHLICGSGQDVTPFGVVINANVTTYLAIAGRLVANTTEATWRANVLLNSATWQPTTLSNLECYLDTNTVTAATTLRTRVNGANGAQSVSIGSSTTGYFEDTTNTDTVYPTDEINYQMVTGATGTSLSVLTVGVLVTVPDLPDNTLLRVTRPRPFAPGLAR